MQTRTNNNSILVKKKTIVLKIKKIKKPRDIIFKLDGS